MSNKLEKIPLLLDLNKLKNVFEEDRLIGLVENLESVFKSRGLHPQFPYPFYIISQDPLPINNYFSTIKSRSLLPTHFKLSYKGASQRELKILRKIFVNTSKLRNIDTKFLLESMHQENLYYQRFYDELIEYNFLDDILKKLFKDYNHEEKR